MADLQLLDGRVAGGPDAEPVEVARTRPRTARHLRAVPPPEPAPAPRSASSPTAPAPAALGRPGTTRTAPAGSVSTSTAPAPPVAPPTRPAPTPTAPPRPVAPRRASPRPVSPCPASRRVLVRPLALPPHIARRRRVAAAVGVAVLTMLAVVLLGVLVDVVAAARAGGPGPEAVTERSLTAVLPGSGQAVVVDPR